MHTDISFISQSFRGSRRNRIFQYLREQPPSIHVATRFIGEQDQQDRHGELAGLSGNIPSSSSKSCASIIKIVHVAYVRTQNHLQHESLEYSFPCIRLTVISLEFADVSRMFLAVDFNDDSRLYERGTTVTPQSVSIPRYITMRRRSRREYRDSIFLQYFCAILMHRTRKGIERWNFTLFLSQELISRLIGMLLK